MVTADALTPRPIPELLDPHLPEEGLGERLFTRLGTALDATLLGAMQLVVDRLMMPSPEEMPSLRASGDLLLDPALRSEPERFFDFSDSPDAPLGSKAHFRRSLRGGIAVARQFTTGYRSFGEDPERHAGAITSRILVEHWMHEPGDARRGTLVALHGFTMGQPRIDAIALFASEWFSRGLDVALVTLPYHGARTPPEAHFSGEWFAVPNVTRLAEAVRMAVYEARLVVDWMRARSDQPVGVLGLSLGGYLTAVLASLYEDLDFAIPMVPPVCIGDLAWRFFTRSRRYREGAAGAFGREELRELFGLHSPLSHTLRVPRERVLIVAGRGDRVVPPEHPHALWRHWGEPPIHWFSGSHIAPFGRGAIVRRVARHLEELDVL